MKRQLVTLAMRNEKKKSPPKILSQRKDAGTETCLDALIMVRSSKLEWK